MGEGFFRQTRRFFAGGLTPARPARSGKENRRSMAEKDPLRRRPTVMKTGSYTLSPAGPGGICTAELGQCHAGDLLKLQGKVFR